MMNKAEQLIKPLIIILSSLVIGFILRKILYTYLQKLTRKTKSKIDDVIIKATKSSYFLWVLMGGLYLALRFSDLSQDLVLLFNKIIFIIVIISITVVLSNITKQAIQLYTDKFSTSLPITSLTKNLSSIIIFIIGTLFVFNALGISITPILTALGVGGLAVALALQDTLSNLFSGLYISLSRQIKPGDYIKLDSNEEGYVVDITWRSLKIRTLNNNIVIIPNTKVSQSIVTNFNLPEKKMAISIPVKVSYDSDPEFVEKVLIDEITKAQEEIPGLSKETAPSIRFIPGFGSFSIDFTILCYINEFKDQFPIQHELNKKIFKRLKKEKIEIPYPTQTIIQKNN